MKTVFILGQNPSLSQAEISSIFPNISQKLLEEVLIMEIPQEIKAKELIRQIGGTIKIGRVLKEVDKKDLKNSLEEIILEKKPNNKKFFFGFSLYDHKFVDLKRIGLEIKKLLKEEGVSSRLVTGRESKLSSVIVEENKLVEDNGLELMIIADNQNYIIAETLAVQPFKELSKRDYGRPQRDDLSGMLPPKLAQIMLNLALGEKRNEEGLKILDPFCGSGTVLSEALLLGYKNLIGSDISERALDDTAENLDWTVKQMGVEGGKSELILSRAEDLDQEIKKESIDIIVTEPYLGPQRGFHEIKKTIKELELLYSQALTAFHKILKKDGRLVMIWPVFMSREGALNMNPNIKGWKKINEKIFNTSNRRLWTYGRSGQKVFREIVVLEKSL